MDLRRFWLVDGGHRIAVGVHRSPKPPYNTHAGLVYQGESGAAHFLHQAWHNTCLNDPLPPSALIVVPQMPELRARFFQRLAIRIANHPARRNLPYALKSPDETSFAPDGRVLFSGNGLNCSYFVTEFFARHGFPLVDVGSWEFREEDRTWHEQLVNWLAQRAPVHAARLWPEVGCQRVRPEEVAGAVACERRPVGYQEALRAGVCVLALLDTHDYQDSAL